MEQQLTDLISFFEGVTLPTEPIRLDVCTVIESPAVFVSGHIQYVTKNINKENAKPYIQRLIRFRDIILENDNIRKI